MTFSIESEDRVVKEVSTAYLLRQVAERLALSLTQSLKPFNQSTSAYRVLIALTRHNPSSMRELIEATLTAPSTLSRTIDALEKDGCVKCSPIESDGRARQVTLTAEGERRLQAILPAAVAQYEWSIRNIEEKDLQMMHQTLMKMLQNLKASPIK
ncbi:MAG TPA: MarR family transcriptional regulator [Pusillimonas sp.]|uniref:MarR family winged helix-turn-helix transcriptional regulator n=1 Tax=Pusillimonas sp. TaxID=3040095 RepID=UPI002C079702|nr:MarR family transcriptional regulator [Pusillimonas sp.]HUH87189.1 MarR family transcriptional regulator [Pusillimonas sp.]